jgi:phosphopantothenoylcysteine decarboxylase/phosphopantothenate--cysteine ligase
MEKKSCDLMVVNGAEAIGAADNSVEVLDRTGQVIGTLAGAKEQVAGQLFQLIEAKLIR